MFDAMERAFKYNKNEHLQDLSDYTKLNFRKNLKIKI
jgi:hypothetical protein